MHYNCALQDRETYLSVDVNYSSVGEHPSSACFNGFLPSAHKCSHSDCPSSTFLPIPFYSPTLILTPQWLKHPGTSAQRIKLYTTLHFYLQYGDVPCHAYGQFFSSTTLEFLFIRKNFPPVTSSMNWLSASPNRGLPWKSIHVRRLLHTVSAVQAFNP